MLNSGSCTGEGLKGLLLGAMFTLRVNHHVRKEAHILELVESASVSVSESGLWFPVGSFMSHSANPHTPAGEYMVAFKVSMFWNRTKPSYSGT